MFLAHYLISLIGLKTNGKTHRGADSMPRSPFPNTICRFIVCHRKRYNEKRNKQSVKITVAEARQTAPQTPDSFDGVNHTGR